MTGIRGVRPLTRKEVAYASRNFRGRFHKRNLALFLFQAYTGWRISQALALRLRDVLNLAGEIVSHVWIDRRHVKGRTAGQVSYLPEVCRNVLVDWIRELRQMGYRHHDNYLFQSYRGQNQAMSRMAVYIAYGRVFKRCGFEGRLGTHSLRKFFTMHANEHFEGNLVKVQALTGHMSLDSLVHYLEGCDDTEARECVDHMGDLRYGMAG